MKRSLLAPGLIGLVMLAGATGHVALMLGAGSAAIAIFASLLYRQPEIEVQASELRKFSIAGLWALEQPSVRYLPLYVAGVGFGVKPAMDWYTAQVDGMKVLVIEPVEVPRDDKA